jgi:hypothetical protein
MANLAIFETLLNDVDGAAFIGLDTEVSVTLKGGKKNEFQGRVTKRTVGSNVILFTNKNQNGYENKVNRELVKAGLQGEFKVGPRVWGNRVANTPFVEHKGNHYLEVIFQKAGTSEYFVDGVQVDPDSIPGLDREPKNDKEELGVFIRTYALESIKGLRFNGKNYQF